MSTFDSIILFTALCVVEAALIGTLAGIIYYASSRVYRSYRNELGAWIVSRAITEYSHNHPKEIAEYKRKAGMSDEKGTK